MGLLGEAIARLKLDSGGFTGEVAKASTAWSGFRSNLSQGLAMGVGMAGLGLLQNGILGIGKAMIDGNSKMEQYAVQMEVLYKDADKAKEKIKELTDFAANTPFEIPQVVATGKILKAFGMDSIKQLQLVGDAAAATGRPLEEIALAMGRLKSGAFGEAFQRFRELGLVTNEMMTKQMGKNMFDSSGQFTGSIKDAMNAVNAILEQNVGGMMDKLSQTVEGKVSNIKDAIGTMLRALGEGMFTSFSSGLSKIMPAFQGLTLFIQGESRKSADIFENTFGKPLSDKIIGSLNVTKKYFELFFGGMITLGKEAAEHIDLITAAVVGFTTRFVLMKTVAPVLTGISGALGGITLATVTSAGVLGTLSAAFTAVKAAMGPIGLIMTGIQIAVTALSYAWASDFAGMRTWVTSVIEEVQRFFRLWSEAREKAAQARREMGDTGPGGLRRFRTEEDARKYIETTKSNKEKYEADRRAANTVSPEEHNRELGRFSNLETDKSVRKNSDTTTDTTLDDTKRGGGGKDKTAFEAAEETLARMKKISDIRLKDELDYWRAVSAAGTMAGDDRLMLEQRILEVTRQYTEEEYSLKKAKMDQDAIWSVDLHDRKIALATEHAAKVKTLYGEDSAEFVAAITEQKRAEKEKYDYFKQIFKEYNDFLATYQEAKINNALKEAEWQKQHGQITQDQLFQIQQVAEQRLYETKRQKLLDELNESNLSIERKMQLNQQLVLIEQQHLAQMDELRRNHITAKLQEEGQYYQQIGSFFVDYLAGLANGTRQFADFWRAMWSLIVDIAAQFMKKALSNWIQDMLIKKLTAKKTQSAIAAGEAAGASAGISAAQSGFTAMMGMLSAVATAIGAIMPAGPALAASMKGGIVAAQAVMLASTAAAHIGVAAMAGKEAISGFKYGGDIDQDGIIMAHKNEKMLPVEEAAYLKKAATQKDNPEDSSTIIFTQYNNFLDGQDLMARLGQFAEEITNMVARVNSNTRVISES